MRVKSDKYLNKTGLNLLNLLLYESRVCRITVGDSRSGWCTAYQKLLDLAVDNSFPGVVEVFVNVSNIRPKGEPLKGFGGVG